MNQTKCKEWVDEQGRKVPVAHVGKPAKLQEAGAAKLLKEAMVISNRMVDFKKLIDKISDDVITAVASSFNGKKPSEKGNYTWYNFDRSVKVEVSVNDYIIFDDITIKMSKEKLDEFINQSLSGDRLFIKGMVQSAFSTKRGNLDAKKVLELTRYRTEIKHPLFQESLNLLEASIRRSSSAKYFKLYVKLADGKYEYVNLNFSSI